MLNFRGSDTKGNKAQIHQAHNGYSVYTWCERANVTYDWQEIHGLPDWLTAFGIASRWLDNDFSGLE